MAECWCGAQNEYVVDTPGWRWSGKLVSHCQHSLDEGKKRMTIKLIQQLEKERFQEETYGKLKGRK